MLLIIHLLLPTRLTLLQFKLQVFDHLFVARLSLLQHLQLLGVMRLRLLNCTQPSALSDLQFFLQLGNFLLQVTHLKLQSEFELAVSLGQLLDLRGKTLTDGVELALQIPHFLHMRLLKV